jgi:hypothetical protein
MSDKSDIPEPEQGHRFGVTAAMAAATLTLIAAVIGLVTVVIDRAGSGDESPAEVTSAFTDPDRNGSDGREGTASEGKGAPLDPSRDGNSRSTAKRLIANQLIEASLDAGNDVDWYVYQAPKAETATVEFVEGEGELGYGGVFVTVSEGLKEIDSSDVSISESFAVPRSVSAGGRLFVSVEDLCGEAGCGIGPYSVVVRTGPPG